MVFYSDLPNRSFMIRLKTVLFAFSFVCGTFLCEFSHASSSRALHDNPNKEVFSLSREIFSAQEHVAHEGIHERLGYTFKSVALLEEALHPLLPSRLKRDENVYNNLELLGDSVLGMILKERIITMWPSNNRGINSQFCSALTGNIFLTDRFFAHLDGIQRFLPYEDQALARYCDIVEALIGAIYRDSPKKGLENAKSFVFRMMNDKVLREKWDEFYGSAPSSSSASGASFLPGTPDMSQILEILDPNPASFKALLQNVLQKICPNEPTYTTFFSDTEHGPTFVGSVRGPYVETIEGYGPTVSLAHEDAARRAINHLRGQEIYLPRNPPHKSDYATFIQEYCQEKRMRVEAFEGLSENFFDASVIIEGSEPFTGRESSKKAAIEIAAQRAYDFLTSSNLALPTGFALHMKYKSRLEEWGAKKLIPEPQFLFSALQQTFRCTLRAGPFEPDEMIVGEGIAHTSKADAKKAAFRDVFNQMLRRQEGVKEGSRQFQEARHQQLAERKAQQLARKKTRGQPRL